MIHVQVQSKLYHVVGMAGDVEDIRMVSDNINLNSRFRHERDRDRRKQRSGEKLIPSLHPLSQPAGGPGLGCKYVELSNISEAQTNKIVNNNPNQDNPFDQDFYSSIVVNQRTRSRTLDRGRFDNETAAATTQTLYYCWAN